MSRPLALVAAAAALLLLGGCAGIGCGRDDEGGEGGAGGSGAGGGTEPRLETTQSSTGPAGTGTAAGTTGAAPGTTGAAPGGGAAAPPPEGPEAPPPPRFVVGAVDDQARHGGPMIDQLPAAGFDALGITSYWEPGLSAPTAGELAVLRRTAARAHERGLRIFLAVFHRGSATTPLTPAAQGEFAAYAAAIVRGVPLIRELIVGNEPNLNRFWLPQFGPDGENVAAPAYFSLLARTYDAAKAADPDVRVWGGALAPRGIDRPGTGRDTQSPTRFLRDLGAAFRASGRTRPPLDGFAFHPYPDSSAVPPDRPHRPGSRTLGLADRDRLGALVREAFGRSLPLLYSEYGVETDVPAAKRGLYRGEEPARVVDPATQADHYRRALELAACQDGVAGVLLFHSQDEPDLRGFQSGVHYIDGTRKPSFGPVREAILAARDGCDR